MAAVLRSGAVEEAVGVALKPVARLAGAAD